MAWMQWWLEFLHLTASVMRYELFNPEHRPKLHYSHWNIFGQWHLKKNVPPTFRCEHHHHAGGKQEGPAGRHRPRRWSHWSMYLFVNWLNSEKRHLAMMFEFLHLKSLCRSKQTSFLTLSKDRKLLVSSIILLLRNINCASSLSACHFPASSVSSDGCPILHRQRQG